MLLELVKRLLYRILFHTNQWCLMSSSSRLSFELENYELYKKKK